MINELFYRLVEAVGVFRGKLIPVANTFKKEIQILMSQYS